jgi:hypothetical protein
MRWEKISLARCQIIPYLIYYVMARPIQTTYVVQMGLLKDGEVFGSPFSFQIKAVCSLSYGVIRLRKTGDSCFAGTEAVSLPHVFCLVYAL